MRGNEINTVIAVEVSNIRFVLEGIMLNRLPGDPDVYSRGIIFCWSDYGFNKIVVTSNVKITQF